MATFAIGKVGKLVLSITSCITFAVLMLLRDFDLNGAMLMNMCCYNICRNNAVKGYVP
jgi:hypothetical protein